MSTGVLTWDLEAGFFAGAAVLRFHRIFTAVMLG